MWLTPVRLPQQAAGSVSNFRIGTAVSKVQTALRVPRRGRGSAEHGREADDAPLMETSVPLAVSAISYIDCYRRQLPRRGGA